MITEQLCGHSVLDSVISRTDKRLDRTPTAFVKRRLDEPMSHLILDARYKKVRKGGVIHSRVMLIAIGWAGRRRSRWAGEGLPGNP